MTDYADSDFQRGAQAAREMLARFIEQGGYPVLAESLRLNWHPGWGNDPGAPPDVIDTWEPPECPEGEANYAAYCKAVENDEDHQPDISPQGLSAAARMLEQWAIPMLPANKLGQVPFLRALIESAIQHLRAKAIRDGGFVGPDVADKIEEIANG